MKFLISTLISLSFLLPNYAQKANVSWSEEIKLGKTSDDASIILADNTGVYFSELHLVEAFRMNTANGQTRRESCSLIKLNKDFEKLYENSFDKDLKGKDFENFFVLKDKLFILATKPDIVYAKKHFNLYAAEVDKNTGDLKSEWQEVVSMEEEKGSDKFKYLLTCNADSSHIILVGAKIGKEKNTFEVHQFDNNFKPLAEPVDIENEFEPKKYELTAATIALNGNIVLVGKAFDNAESKNSKARNLEFKNFVIRIYDNKGKQLKEISTEINAKWLVKFRVVQGPASEFVLAAFYSNEKKAQNINGLMIQRIDAATGNIISTNQQDIDISIVPKLGIEKNEDADEDSKARKPILNQASIDTIGFSADLEFRHFLFTQDKGLIIVAEKFKSNPRRFSDGSYANICESGDILISKMEANGTISWMKIIPKLQIEEGFNYSSIGFILTQNNLHLIFNDNPRNAKALLQGQTIYRVFYKFGRTNCDMVSVNIATGNYTRKTLFNNEGAPIAMPYSGKLYGNTMYLMGMQKSFSGKLKIAVGKIVVNN